MILAGAQGDSFFGIPNPRGVRGIVHISPCCCQFPVLSDCVVACAGRSMRYCLISFKPELSLAAETANPDDDGLLRASFPSYHPTSGRRGFSLSYWTCWIGFLRASLCPHAACVHRLPPQTSGPPAPALLIGSNTHLRADLPRMVPGTGCQLLVPLCRALLWSSPCFLL